MYREEDFLQLSGIQHFVFCRRQWALSYIEMQWQENVRTAEGRILHEKAHDPSLKEKRGDLLIVRAMPVHSREMGVSGECDVVEFHKAPEGISLAGREGTYIAIPVEYKRGIPKTDDSDILQVAAQAMCLEEMFSTEIPEGAIFYGETRRREQVEFTEELRGEVRSIFKEMHEYYKKNYTPKVKTTKACSSCSLKEICLPKLGKAGSVKSYVHRMLEDAE